MSGAFDFYQLADALAMTFDVDLSVYRIEGRGKVTLDAGPFKIALDMETISTVLEDDGTAATGDVGMLIKCGSGHLGLFVLFTAASKRIELSPVDLSLLPKDGYQFFEADKSQVISKGVELLTAETGPLVTYVLETHSQGWVKVCSEISSSGHQAKEVTTATS